MLDFGSSRPAPAGTSTEATDAPLPGAISVAGLVDDVRRTVSVPGDIRVDCHIRLHLFRGDPAPVADCLRALLDRAVAWRDRTAGRIMVHCEQNGDFAVFTVHDDGAVRVLETTRSGDPLLRQVTRLAAARGGVLDVCPLVADRGFLARLSWPLFGENPA